MKKQDYNCRRLLIINHSCGVGSVGKICTQIADEYERQGTVVKIAYGRKRFVPKEYKKYAIRIGNSIDVFSHILATRLTDRHGLYSVRATQKFLKWADEFDPELLWLHCIHGYYINYELLFEWIKKRPQMQVRWTQHDCWAITGHCAHFLKSKCEKWKIGCDNCPSKRAYPGSLFMDRSRDNYQRKKTAFSSVSNMEIITPCEWLRGIIGESFIKEYSSTTNQNKIDLRIFRYTESNLKYEYGAEDKTVVLAAASVWNESKGFTDVIKLTKMLDDNYVVVIAGLKFLQILGLRKIFYELPKRCNNIYVYKESSEKQNVKNHSAVCTNSCVVEPDINNIYKILTGRNYDSKKQAKGMHCRVICHTHINNQSDMAKIYSAADYFINPTYEDTYPTVNLEAQACNAIVITYNTGGCAETLV